MVDFQLFCSKLELYPFATSYRAAIDWAYEWYPELRNLYPEGAARYGMGSPSINIPPTAQRPRIPAMLLTLERMEGIDSGRVAEPAPMNREQRRVYRHHRKVLETVRPLMTPIAEVVFELARGVALNRLLLFSPTSPMRTGAANLRSELEGYMANQTEERLIRFEHYAEKFLELSKAAASPDENYESEAIEDYTKLLNELWILKEFAL